MGLYGLIGGRNVKNNDDMFSCDGETDTRYRVVQSCAIKY